MTLVDLERHPLDDEAHALRIRDALRRDGCCVLEGFVRPELVEPLRAECAELAPLAYHHETTVNVYNCDPDPSLPDGHPACVAMRRGNAFVARDRIPEDALIQGLYTSPLFCAFIARCFGVSVLHPLADPLSGLCLNVVDAGRSHPWHFDTNELTVSLLTQRPEAGGEFEYCPAIRSPSDENLDAVGAVLAGDGGAHVRRLELEPGALQLFHGRYALHRVTTVAGSAARHSAIFAYSEQPGVIGTPTRTLQLFGRLSAAHTAAAPEPVDGLLT